MNRNHYQTLVNTLAVLSIGFLTGCAAVGPGARTTEPPLESGVNLVYLNFALQTYNDILKSQIPVRGAQGRRDRRVDVPGVCAVL